MPLIILLHLAPHLPIRLTLGGSGRVHGSGNGSGNGSDRGSGSGKCSVIGSDRGSGRGSGKVNSIFLVVVIVNNYSIYHVQCHW